MSIREIVFNGKKLYEVYINGFNARGVRIQRKRSRIETLRAAKEVEFELKRELAMLKQKSSDMNCTNRGGRSLPI